MESALSSDTEKEIPPVPPKTYQWEDLRKAREIGGYPWTHLLKPPLEGEITAEDIIRETTPRRSMSREVSRSRTHSPIDGNVQRILNLDSSPGSSRKHGEEGEDEGVHIPNFSKEISLESEDDAATKILSTAVSSYPVKRQDCQSNVHLVAPIEIPKNVSPKGILKRRVPEHHYIGVSETREKTKCCHPLVNKIKHLADKTLHKLEKNDNEKSPVMKRRKNDETQEIRQLRNSPGAARRQKFSAIKLGDSDEMSKTLSVDTPPPRKKKEHIYEDIDDKKKLDLEKSLSFSPDMSSHADKQKEDNKSGSKENESIFENKSILSQDPSLIVDENYSLKSQEHVMEKLHSKIEKSNKRAANQDDDMDSEELNVDEIFENQLNEGRKDDSPNITITEITDDDADPSADQNNVTPIATSPTPSPCDEKKRIEFEERRWSRPSSDHEYEIIEKPPPNIIYTESSVDEKQTIVKTDDDLSSTTSLERKYLQHMSDEDEQMVESDNVQDPQNESLVNAQALQKDIEDRFFVNTPSTVSRTECEISTSQVESSALENLPLKRGSRPKNSDNIDSKIQKKLKEGTGKIKTQAGKLKTKLQNIKTKQFTLPDRPKINFPDRSKFKMPERPKISLPDKSKFTLPDRRKFSLPDRPKFKSINLSEKLSLGDRMKFERPKFNVPELPKIKILDRSKINFPSLGRKKEYKVENQNLESNSDLKNVDTVEFEVKTYPRLFSRKKKNNLPKTSSSPTLNRDETPPPTFTFTRVKKTKNETNPYIPDEPQQPREYGNVDSEVNFVNEIDERKQFDGRYDFDKISPEYLDEPEINFSDDNQNASIPDMSPSKQEYTHVINEINNDEFFVRPRGISRENIQVREYLSDEIRQAFKIPKNSLALMGSDTAINANRYDNDVEADPELLIEDDQNEYSCEDVNERDDGYYTFPPVRPSRAKRKQKEAEQAQYLDESAIASAQFSEIDLGLPEDNANEQFKYVDEDVIESIDTDRQCEFNGLNDLHAIHEYANDDVIQYPEAIPSMSQTLPMPPKRKKKVGKKELRHSSLSDFKTGPTNDHWQEPQEQQHDVVVYRTEHEYVVPESEMVLNEHSPIPPRRTRSKSSRCTSICDDDRTSHGAESLILDTHVITADDLDRETRYESPGYATVDKGIPKKSVRRSTSKTPPERRRKSNSSERKYYTVGSKKTSMPDRPPRKKSSTSLLTLDSITKKSSTSLTQYVEIDEPELEEVHKDLNSGEVLNKMKDRPLPPPPRPPRGFRQKRKEKNKEIKVDEIFESQSEQQLCSYYLQEDLTNEKVEEIEVSTQTDPLPDDIDFELSIDDNLDISMNSLRDLVEEESLSKSINKQVDILRLSRPTSRSEKSIKLSDPKISEISKSTLGRTSPTVILVERRVSSPTRINEREEMLTEASLTVQHIDMDESQIPNVPPLPRSREMQTNSGLASKHTITCKNENALETVTDMNKDVRLDNLITQRLQVRDLDVGRLNVSELQASKILVSDIEGMTLQVNELDSKSGHISVSGIEFSQSVIDEIVKKFAEISTNSSIPTPNQDDERAQLVSREEHTQTDTQTEMKDNIVEESVQTSNPKLISLEESDPPQRPPPPDLTPLLYSYLQDIAVPPLTIYHPRTTRERSSELHDHHPTAPPPPARRAKRKPTTPITESSSDDGRPRPSPRRLPPPVKIQEPTVVEAGAQFLRVCQNSISRMIRNIFNSFMSYISGNEDKRDVQMALVIFLVLIAGLIMFGLSENRTIHHHHWEFFNPPDGKQ